MSKAAEFLICPSKMPPDPLPSLSQLLATLSFQLLSQICWNHPLLFLLYPSSDPLANPVGSAFKICLESNHFSPPLQLSPQSSFLFLAGNTERASILVSLLAPLFLNRAARVILLKLRLCHILAQTLHWLLLHSRKTPDGLQCPVKSASSLPL